MMFDVVEGFGKSIAKSRTALLHGYPYAPEWYDASLIDAFMQLPPVRYANWLGHRYASTSFLLKVL